MRDLINFEPGEELVLSDDTKKFIQAIYREGTAELTLDAQKRDLRYFWKWAELALNLSEEYPISVEVILNFITDHLGGMKEEIDQKLVDLGIKAKLGQHSLQTIKRRLYMISGVHVMLNVENPLRNEIVTTLISKARSALASQGIYAERKLPATKDIIEKLIATCGDKLIDKRDKALLLVGFSSGGRRRSELSQMMIEDLTRVEEGYKIKLWKMKNDQKARGKEFPILGLAADALTDWLNASGITSGHLFCSISRGGNIHHPSLTGRAIYRIFKNRIKMAGLDEQLYSIHSIRSGFVTECGRQNLQILQIQSLTGHESHKMLSIYYRDGNILSSKAAKLM
jgi:integrase